MKQKKKRGEQRREGEVDAGLEGGPFLAGARGLEPCFALPGVGISRSMPVGSFGDVCAVAQHPSSHNDSVRSADYAFQRLVDHDYPHTVPHVARVRIRAASNLGTPSSRSRDSYRVQHSTYALPVGY